MRKVLTEKVKIENLMTGIIRHFEAVVAGNKAKEVSDINELIKVIESYQKRPFSEQLDKDFLEQFQEEF